MLQLLFDDDNDEDCGRSELWLLLPEDSGSVWLLLVEEDCGSILWVLLLVGDSGCNSGCDSGGGCILSGRLW